MLSNASVWKSINNTPTTRLESKACLQVQPIWGTIFTEIKVFMKIFCLHIGSMNLKATSGWLEGPLKLCAEKYKPQEEFLNNSRLEDLRKLFRYLIKHLFLCGLAFKHVLVISPSCDKQPNIFVQPSFKVVTWTSWQGRIWNCCGERMNDKKIVYLYIYKILLFD